MASSKSPLFPIFLTVFVDVLGLTLVLPLLLSDAEVQEFRRHAADQQAAPLADSLAASLTSGVRSQARVLRDSIRADSLERVAQRIRQRVDSLRGKSSVLPPPAGQKP